MYCSALTSLAVEVGQTQGRTSVACIVYGVAKQSPELH
jgi:hypothetical protein